jgi:dTDP-4-dehydrorhamnose 3,5-epimerase
MTLNHVDSIDGVIINKIKSVADARGTFYKFDPALGFKDPLNAVALSINPKVGTLRGLHFQIEPFGEEKLVSCVKGSIFDVILDLRPDSRTLGKWTTFELSAENRLQAYLPKGIAHGFQTLMPDSIIHYSLGSTYSPDSSYSINPFGDLGIEWPIVEISISDRDARGITLAIALQKYSESLTN